MENGFADVDRQGRGALARGDAMSAAERPGATPLPIEYRDASAEVRAVYDDIMATRKTDWVNNYWKVLAHHPPSLRRMWANAKEVMGPGALDPLTKELIYLAVSVTNGCKYCIASHGAAARAKGLTPDQHAELVAIIGLANETNRHAVALDLQIDEQFR
jgi:AhpD family alkylhydroperoxidase